MDGFPLDLRLLVRHTLSRLWKENAGPMVDKVKRGVKKGVEEATKDDKGSAGSGSAQPAPAVK